MAFWKQEAEIDPQETYEALLQDERIAGVHDLRIDTVIAAVLKAFPDSVREPCGPEREWIVGEGGSFQIEWSSQHVLMTLRPLNGKLANRMIDVMNGFDCPLYDPQTGERFVLGR